MSTGNSLNVLTAKLSAGGQQRLFEFLDVIDTDTAGRFRSWLGTVPDNEVSAAADLLNRVSHGREFAGWWNSHDKVSAAQVTPPPARPRPRGPIELMHSQARARSANRDLTVGGAWLLGGVLVTIVSYSMAASNPRGGTFVVATGAMLYGALRLFRGFRTG